MHHYGLQPALRVHYDVSFTSLHLFGRHRTLWDPLDKGISWAGIGGGVRIGGLGPRVVGPGAAGVTVSGILRAERPHVGESAGVAGRAVRRTEAAGVWRESDGGVR